MNETRHHHHHHDEDESSVFIHRSLNAIERRKKIEKYTYWATVIIAVAMAAMVFVAYTTN